MLWFERAKELLEADLPEQIFLVQDYVPIQSKILLHGMPSLGKTPLAWAIAEAVQTGGEVLGIPARQGNALVIETDMAAALVKDRWKKADPKFEPSFALMFVPGGFDTFRIESIGADEKHRRIRKMLLKYADTWHPRLVVIDALREVIRGEISSTGIADRLYGIWLGLFPEATIMFLHHENKPNEDPTMKKDPMSRAKGSQEFSDIATVAIRMEKGSKGTVLRVTKSQAGPIPEPRLLHLAKDGVHFL